MPLLLLDKFFYRLDNLNETSLSFLTKMCTTRINWTLHSESFYETCIIRTNDLRTYFNGSV